MYLICVLLTRREKFFLNHTCSLMIRNPEDTVYWLYQAKIIGVLIGSDDRFSSIGVPTRIVLENYIS